MKIKYKNKVFEGEYKTDGRLFAGKLFAGYGEGNMNYGFKIYIEPQKKVQEHAPKGKDV